VTVLSTACELPIFSPVVRRIWAAWKSQKVSKTAMELRPFGPTTSMEVFGFEKYAHRYLAQVQYLFNRRFDLRSITRLARAASQVKPCPLQVACAAEPSG
jgi:hypothetical protein